MHDARHSRLLAFEGRDEELIIINFILNVLFLKINEIQYL